MKENTRDFRNKQQDSQNKKKIEYGKVVSNVTVRKGLKSYSTFSLDSHGVRHFFLNKIKKTFLKSLLRQRNDQIRRMEQKRAREKMELRRRNSEKIKKFYTTKDEETDSDSEDEEDEVLDFHKQKSEVIFWNDPRIKMTKKDIQASSLAKSMGRRDVSRHCYK